VFIFSYRVGYYEADRMNVMHHARYFEIFERARTELLRAAGKTYREVEDGGVFLPVVEATARYRAPIYYDEEIAVETRVERLSVSEVRFAYRIMKADGTVAAEGLTRHAIVGPDFRLLRLKGERWDALNTLLKPYLTGGA
jgi:acyl-CoA thioester hydrolase